MLQEEAELFQAYGEDFAPEYRKEHWAQGPQGRAPASSATPVSATPGAMGTPLPVSTGLPTPAQAVPGATPASFRPSVPTPLPASAAVIPSTPTASPPGFHPPASPAPMPASATPAPTVSTAGRATTPSATSHPSHGELPPVEGVTRNGGREQWRGGAWVTSQPGRFHEGEVRVNPDGSRLIFRKGDWVRGDEVSQVVIFSDGSFRVYYLDGHWRQGRRGEHYPTGCPIFHDVATLPVGPRFSFFVSGIDAYRLDNLTNEKFKLGQFMPDGRVLVGSILYHPRPDGTLEWIGPTPVGQNPQADANLVALEAAVKTEAVQAKKTAVTAAKAEREEATKRARDRRHRQPVMGRPAPMASTPSVLPSPVGTTPAYVIAASAPSGPSLEEIAEVAAEAGYEGAQLAVEEFQAEAFEAPPIVVEELDIFGGGDGVYVDPRS